MKFHFAPTSVYPKGINAGNYEEHGWTICGWITDHYFRQLTNALTGKQYKQMKFRFAWIGWQWKDLDGFAWYNYKNALSWVRHVMEGRK